LTGKDNTELGFGDYTGRSVVDTSFHWAYSLPGYEKYSIEENGTPIVPHLHGGHNNAPYDGNPEYFFSPGFEVRGPDWEREVYVYHDHALGITRLSVYAGMAGFYISRDHQDTGTVDNPLGLPAFPYEVPLVIQDRMFKENGELFYPAFQGDPYYEDFITA
jgi:spore coat protein A, manganese oxidase